MSLENIKQNETPLTWTTADCAAFFRKSPKNFANRIAVLPTFPKAMRIPTTSGGMSHPLYYRNEVIEWAEKHREAA